MELEGFESLKLLAVAAAGYFTAAATDFSRNPLELSFDLKILLISKTLKNDHFENSIFFLIFVQLFTRLTVNHE